MKLRDTRAWVREHFCTIDPRTLGLFRLVLGFVLVGDCIRHWAVAPTFYSNEGVLTNHFHLFRPSSGYNVSLYHAFSTVNEVHVAFALSLVCYFMFWIGWKTRVFAALSFVLVTSMDHRLVMTENGGYVVVNLATLYAALLPTDRRFSVDAMIRSYRERLERTAADLNERCRPAWKVEPYVSALVLLAVVNLAFVYFFNVVNKSGQLWRTGETVHYVLHLDRMVTGLAVFFREILPLPVTKALSWLVLSHEALLFTAIMAPYGRRVTRTYAVLGIFALHVTFGVMMRLGPFSWFLIAWSMLLVVPEQWAMFERWHARRTPALVVAYDATSPLALWFARLLARLDGPGRLCFEEASGPELLVAREEGSGAVHTGRAALRACVRALPFGRVAHPLLVACSFGLVGPLFQGASRRRAGVARYFGLLAPMPGAPPAGAPPAPSRARQRLVKARTFLRETLVAWLVFTAVWQAVNENKSIPKEVKDFLKPPWIPEPIHKVMNATIQYPRIFQGWGMFSPNPISDDGSVTVDAWTIDGRHIDPFTGREPDLDLTDARGLGLGQIIQDYFNRIRLDRNKAYRPGLSEHLQAYHLRTGRPEDELVAFDVYWVRDQCPKPGESQPTKNEIIALLTYRKPRYKPAEGLPALPPVPKVESAGN